MFKFKASTLIFISGLIWFGVGMYLLPLGLHFLIYSAQRKPNWPLAFVLGTASCHLRDGGIILCRSGIRHRLF